jgi:hypothetical protein
MFLVSVAASGGVFALDAGSARDESVWIEPEF